jgi:hypothetical protein
MIINQRYIKKVVQQNGLQKIGGSNPSTPTFTRKILKTNNLQQQVVGFCV